MNVQSVLILHSYPPTPCLYGFEKGMRELGFDVTVAANICDYGDREQFKELEPNYELLEITTDRPLLLDLFNQMRKMPDCVMYLHPNNFYLPSDLGRCPVPTIGWLTEEYKCRELYEILFPYFDLAPTSFVTIAAQDADLGYDNRPYFDFRWLQWLKPNNFPATRSVDVGFVGAIGVSGVTDKRDAELMLLLSHTKIDIRSNLWLKELLDFYTNCKIVWQHGGQGENNLTYRISEATAAGAAIISKRPENRDLAGLVENEGILLYDTHQEFKEKISQVLEDESYRCWLVDNARLLMVGDNHFAKQVERFVGMIDALPDNFLELRKERMNIWRS